MTITTQHVPAHAWLARKAAEALWDRDTFATPHPAIRSAVLTISGLPTRLRPVIERALVVCLRSEPAPAPAGTDPLTADFFTRWSRDARGLRCRQVVTGTESELNALSRVIGELAAENGFSGTIAAVDKR